MFKNGMFLLALFLFSSTSIAASRIKPLGADWLRCSDGGITHEECDYDRRESLKSGCITQEELDLIKSYNGCPGCKISEKGPDYIGWCPVGCFVRGTKILVWDGVVDEKVWAPIEEIVKNSSRFKVAALRSGSRKSEFDYDFFPIRLTTSGPEMKPLVMIHAEDGLTLGLTSTHGVVLASGILVAAEMLRAGDQLLLENGESLKISEISRPETSDDVFNLSVETNADVSHLIIAEGLVVGDQFLQGSHTFNSTILK